MRIHLHGYLKTLYPDELSIQASTVAEAVTALQLIPALRNQGRHSVAIDGFASRDALYDRCDVQEIHIRPVVAGAGRGLGQIIIGIAIIAVAFYFPQLLAALPGGGISVGSAYLAGAMMVLGGVLAMLSPQPQIAGPTSEDKSRYLGTPKNTVLIGTRIPMIYGRRKAYGQYISFNIVAGDFNAAPASWYASPFTTDGALNNAAAPVDLPMSLPYIRDSQPQSLFVSVKGPVLLTDPPDVFVKFAPPVTLPAGQHDINFATGQTLHVTNLAAGLTGSVKVLGGSTANLPPAGTPIIFTRNYG